MTTHQTEANLYVLDTHALYWYWTDPPRLSDQANAAFQQLERKKAIGIVPFIVIPELHYLTAKRHEELSVEGLLRLVHRAPSLRLEGLSRRHLLAFGRLGDIPEMRDRLIGAVALVHDAPIVSRDSVLHNHSLVRVIW